MASTKSSPKVQDTSADKASPVFDLKSLKHLNANLAASAQQSVRDKALEKLETLLVQNDQWFADDVKHADMTVEKQIRMLWEGLFYSK